MLRRWRRICAFLVASAALQLALEHKAVAEPLPAEEMLADCQALLSTAKTNADPEAIELDNTFATGACWGAFLSIQQLVTVKIAGTKNPAFQVCVPEDTALVQLIQLFEAYARRHPERRREPFTIVAIAALHEAFRCK